MCWAGQAVFLRLTAVPDRLRPVPGTPARGSRKHSASRIRKKAQSGAKQFREADSRKTDPAKKAPEIRLRENRLRHDSAPGKAGRGNPVRLPVRRKQRKKALFRTDCFRKGRFRATPFRRGLLRQGFFRERPASCPGRPCCLSSTVQKPGSSPHPCCRYRYRLRAASRHGKSHPESRTGHGRSGQERKSGRRRPSWLRNGRSFTAHGTPESRAPGLSGTVAESPFRR